MQAFDRPSMITPATRRKYRSNMKRRRQEMIRSITALSLLVFLSVIFLLLLRRSYDKQKNNNIIVGGRYSESAVGAAGALRGGNQPWITPDSQPFNMNKRAAQAHHLIMVAGHSVTVTGHLQDADQDEADWFLFDYQKGRGLPQAIGAHIRAGIEEASNDPNSLLIFSGGETRAVTGPFTEGSSYFHVADAMNMWPVSSDVRARSVTEEFATDSFENLLFSICRFKEVTGSYPTKITVVSFSFKQRRFENLHAPALGWPLQKFHYIGIDPPASTGFDLQASTKGELENAARPFEQDPYGCNTPVLQEKRKSRNPFSRTPPYALTCTELGELLNYCGTQLFPKEKLPWGRS